MGEAEALPPPAFELTDRDKAILAQTDEEYHYLTWDETKSIIGTNRDVQPIRSLEEER